MMDKFYAGIKGSVEILKPEKGTFLSNHSDMVEPLSIYVYQKSMSWRYRLNYKGSNEKECQDGLVIDFKNMPDDTKNKDAFTEKLDKITREPWFQGRLGNIRADIAWIEMNSLYKNDKSGPDKLEERVVERLKDNLHDITTRLVGLQRAFSKDALKVHDLSVSNTVSVAKSKNRV